MTPEEHIAEMLLSHADREEMHEWPVWRLNETLSNLHVARMAFRSLGRYELAPIEDACALIEREFEGRVDDLHNP